MRLAGSIVALGACSFAHGTVPSGQADAPAGIDARQIDAPDGSTALARRQVKITFDNSTRAEAFSDFPFLAILNSSNLETSRVSPTGADVRFNDPDGTPLAYQIEAWDLADTSFVWVRVPQIDASSSSDFIWMSYGDPSATDAQDPTGVWSSDYVGVWHLADDPGDHTAHAIKDSTSNAHDGTANALMVSGDRVPGQIGAGFSFGTHLGVLTDAAYPLATYTWTAWINPAHVPMSPSAGNTNALADGDVNFNFAWDHGSTAFRAATAQLDSTSWKSVTLGAGITANSWYHLAGRYDGTNVCLFSAGAQVGCVAAGTPLAPTTLPFSIGIAPDSTGTFAGLVDEVRVTSTALTALRLAAEHASETNTLASYGAPQDVP